jgi:outer membrane protein TolC
MRRRQFFQVIAGSMAATLTGTSTSVMARRFAQIEQTLPPLERQLAQQRHLLSSLSGGLPSEEPPEKFEFDGLHLPRDLPVSLPSQLVEQRPDVRAAEANMHYASALIGVAGTSYQQPHANTSA